MTGKCRYTYCMSKILRVFLDCESGTFDVTDIYQELGMENGKRYELSIKEKPPKSGATVILDERYLKKENL